MSEPSPLPTRRWRLAPPLETEGRALAEALGVSRTLGKLLAARGFADPAEAGRFLRPSLSDFHDAKRLPDYHQAERAILGAKERGDLIYVHGDYDVDGVTSAAIFTRFLRKIGCSIAPHVPHRMKEGYGIHLDAVKAAKDQGAKLFLTCDCGVSAHEQVEAATSAGLTVVITDHHELKDTLPGASAVINPHRSDSDYPFTDLSGAGVVFKVCSGITQTLGKSQEGFHRAYLDLAVLGTVADVVPLRDENRIIAREGLGLLKASRKPGIRALLTVCELDSPHQVMTPRTIGFQIAPRINAVGRLDDAAVALDLLLTEDGHEALRLAKSLDDHNSQRRLETTTMVSEALLAIEQEGLLKDRAIVVAKEGWHPGIIGLVASRLVETYTRPAFVIGIGAEGVGKGSARSIPGFHLADTLRDAEGTILGGGGHEMAAGFSILAEQIPSFRALVAARAGQLLTEEDLIPVLHLEAEVSLGDGGEDLAAEIAQMEPFGQSNPPPLLLCRGVELKSVTPMRSPEHARLTLADQGKEMPAVIFRRGLLAASLLGARVDCAFRPEFDTYAGRTTFRWLVEDIRPAEAT
jgi:single-stranded-DNA-specific exonuclease